MIPPFDEALADLLGHYSHHDPDALIADLQRAIDGLKDTAAEQKEISDAHVS